MSKNLCPDKIVVACITIVSFSEYCILHCEHVEHGLHVCLAGLGYQALHKDFGRVEAELLQPVREEVRLDLLDL